MLLGVILAPGSTAYPLSSHAFGLADCGRYPALRDARAANASFKPLWQLHFDGGVVRPNCYWVRLSIESTMPSQPWGLQMRGSVSGVQMYVPAGRGAFDRFDGGLDSGSGGQSIGGRFLAFPAAAYGATIYLRVVDIDGPSDLSIVPLRIAHDDIVRRMVLHMVFIGFFVAIGALYLFLYLALRNWPLLQYTGVMAAISALLFVDSNTPWLIVPSTMLQRTVIHDVAAYAYFVSIAAFSISFLRLRTRDAVFCWIIIAALVLNAVGLLADYVEFPQWFGTATDVVTIGFFGTMFVAALRAARAGMRPARLYAIAIFMVLAGYAVNAIDWYDIFPGIPQLSIWLFEVAIAAEALLLAIAVAQRMQETTREYERLLVTSAELEDLALRDGLTGVLNRRAFDRQWGLAWNVAVSRGGMLGILMIDIDHFKDYNDRFGHPAGDECLRAVAQACAGCVRSNDLFARYGGEEFAAIVPSATYDDLEQIADRMRDAVDELGIVTISIGAATMLARANEASNALIERADAALYLAKARGRNRTIFASEGTRS